MSTVGVLPLEAVGYESIEAFDEGLTLQWQPQVGSGFGLRLQKEISKAAAGALKPASKPCACGQLGPGIRLSISGEETSDTLSLQAGATACRCWHKPRCH